ncbi:MAG: hypothetical protein ACOYL3_16160 [Desulfuromonadaceae bacterium]
MSTNYKQQDGAFSKWIRAGFAAIANAYGQPPAITYAEQEVSILDGGEPTIVRKNAIKKSFNPAFTFPVYDAVTGAEKSIATEQDFYEMAAAHYLATAALRDAGDPTVITIAYPRMFPEVSLTPVPAPPFPFPPQ